MAELSANLARGNHKSANSNPEELEEKMNREVQYGFSLPVWTSIITKIPKAMLQACNLVSQWTLSKTGERKKKSRLTHDLSFAITDPNATVNRRLNRQVYPELIYGFCLLRVIHYIVALRLVFRKRKYSSASMTFRMLTVESLTEQPQQYRPLLL